jgi:uncharacterized membrane protein AbrB (regulator of aidB expression)
MALLLVIALHAEGTVFFGHTAMSMRTSRHKVKLGRLFGVMPCWHFTFAQTVVAWHIGVGFEKTKVVKLESQST